MIEGEDELQTDGAADNEQEDTTNAGDNQPEPDPEPNSALDQDSNSNPPDPTDEVADSQANVPGFHVHHPEGHRLGIYATLEAAEAFIAGHLRPQGIEGTVKEVQ